MATALKTLRTLRTPATRTRVITVTHRNNSNFKDPWEYPPSARVSVQSFREAKIEFKEPRTIFAMLVKKLPIEQTQAMATLQAFKKDEAMREAKRREELERSISGNIHVDQGIGETAKATVHDGAWEKMKFECPWNFMLNEHDLERLEASCTAAKETLLPGRLLKSRTKKRSTRKKLVKEEKLDNSMPSRVLVREAALLVLVLLAVLTPALLSLELIFWAYA